MELKPDRNLIDPKFDGYKLSLDHLPSYKIPLDKDVDEVALRADQYTYQHVKAFGLHNYIYPDPWTGSVLIVDGDWNVRSHHISQEAPFQAPVCVFQVPEGAEGRMRQDRVPVTLHCTAAGWLLVADGVGNLYVLNTGDRHQNSNWTIHSKLSPLEPTDCEERRPQPFTLLHSAHRTDSSGSHIEALLLHVDKNPAADNENRAPPYLTKLTWFTLTSTEDERWEVGRTRELSGSSSPDYAALEPTGQALMVASTKPFHFTSDSLRPVETPAAQNGTSTKGEDAAPGYVWTQTEEDVTVFYSLAPDVTKPDITYSLHTDSIDLEVKNSCVLLKGPLAGAVDVEASMWTITQEQGLNKLEVHLEKQQPGLWPDVVVGNTRGHLVADEEQLEQINEKLAYLTSSQANPDPDQPEKPYNSQELEDCDLFSENSSTLTRIDGDTHKVTHKIDLSSHQWLFNVQSEADKAPCVCLRHDVDGLVWQPIAAPDDTSPWKHAATFNAFGYVQASKQQKKFASCAPDFSYAVICDCMRHIYIYRQPSAISSPIRNRKTGREVDAVAKQQLVSLDTTDDVLGLFVSNEKLFVLLRQTLHMIRVNAEVV